MNEKAELPEKNNLESLWRDDAKLVKQINDAIDCAKSKEWDKSEKLLEDAEFDIKDWEPYDTSDVYFPGIWGSQIKQIRQYIKAYKK